MSVNKPESESVLFARRVIASPGEAKTLDEVLRHAKQLKGENRFDLARRIMSLAKVATDDPQYLYVHQQIANCTYKDEDIPMPRRFFDAVQELQVYCNLASTTVSETLGLAGAIYKRLWRHDGQRSALESSLCYYHRAHVQKPKDDGYVSINTAFLLDLLAGQERLAGDVPPDVPVRRFAAAKAIRAEVVADLRAQGAPVSGSWWYHASLAEGLLGLGEYVDAAAELQEGRRSSPVPWELESTARQVATLAVIHTRHLGAPKAELYKAIGDGFALTPRAVEGLAIGKVGLALSGGGFRASLFHIGMLAKLAELDVLRHVEVLSCVSGGSIVGAFYYLALKQRLEDPAKPSLDQSDYVEIVCEVQRKFLAGVQRNIRTRIASSPWAALKMAFVPGYTRTSRAGELYDSELYGLIDDIRDPKMTDLVIDPQKKGSRFNPKYENWARDSKVPILVLNATTLNTGHNWQFSAKWMGESPNAVNDSIDSIPRLRRMYYAGDGLPKNFETFPLGQAVGASACVPGVFEPIVMRNLYPDRAVRLVDGGVHDNQGIASLLEQSCNIFLVSDASGQMRENLNPGGAVLSVSSRTNSTLQARVREAQHDEVLALERSGGLDGLMFIHLTKDLESDPVSWVGARDGDEVAVQRPPTTTYGVDRELQLKLAQVRTDLDSFSDAEAYALMMSAYLMTEESLMNDRCVPTLPLRPVTVQWDFECVRDGVTMHNQEDNERLHRLLSTSKQLAGKVWKQSTALKVLAGVGGAALVFAVGRSVVRNWNDVPSLGGVLTKIGSLKIGTLVEITGAVLLLVILRYTADKVFRYQKRFGELLLGLMLATVGWAAAWLHLLIFDRMFLSIGRWKVK
jgi:predicted acylesterase/phospholipase RssA